MNQSAHSIEGVNRTQNMWFHPFFFTGKEKDEETGYGYFGARYMDHDLMTLWISVDPMADKYPSISPYVYCAWNPVKLVDLDGKDVWYVTEEGKVKKINDDGGLRKQTVIYENKHVDMFYGTKYHKSLSELSKEHNNVSSTYGNAEMQSTYAGLFKSLADNTNVEWAMERYTNNQYALGTLHNESLSPNSSELSGGRQSDNTVVTLIHSHPMTNGYMNPTSIENQVSSMGYLSKKRVLCGDAFNKNSSLRNAFYYTYFPRTHQLWSVEKKEPAFIRTIRSVSDFYFGTYNSR